MCSLSNNVSRDQNDCLSFKLKRQDAANCQECWYFLRLLPGNAVFDLNWNELIPLFITEIMTSVRQVICIIGAN